jgi:hypothetical protein
MQESVQEGIEKDVSVIDEITILAEHQNSVHRTDSKDPG